jgi:hypothetical protein
VLVNSHTAGSQTDASVTAVADGGLVIVWLDTTHAKGDSAGRAVRRQRHAADGTPIGGAPSGPATIRVTDPATHNLHG